ncbi:hypothetical protein ACTTAK_06575 [Rhodobacter capsulatus]|uniref:hypothetical protein n=1 Tax=Rhodobacter capsulatus TaxID=1061 RepID=UPI00114508EA|nr:hypothetical protein [Rhodobacter capsulatus]TQD37454.1 hypothetical protein FKW81_02420 [Rhodobacter capsulatus]
MMFLLTAEDENMRLKSYSATIKGTSSVMKIEIEYYGHDEFNWALHNLRQIEAAQKAAKPAKAKSLKAPAQQLALPAPVRALPPPKGGA